MDIGTFDNYDHRIPERNDAMSSCSKQYLLPSLSTGMFEYFGLVEGFEFDLDYFGLVLQASLIFVSGSDSGRSADFKEKGRRRRSAQQGLDQPDPTGPILGLSSGERSCEVRPDRPYAKCSPGKSCWKHSGVRSGGPEVSKRDFS